MSLLLSQVTFFPSPLPIQFVTQSFEIALTSVSPTELMATAFI